MAKYRRQYVIDNRMAIGREARKMISEGWKVKDVAAQLGVTRTRLYRAMNAVAAIESTRDPLLD